MWKENSPNIWRLSIDTFLLAVFHPVHDRQNWSYSINHQNSVQTYPDLATAQRAALKAAEQHLADQIAQLTEVQRQVQHLIAQNDS